MNLRFSTACVLCAFALLFSAACAGDDSDPSVATTVGGNSTPATAQAAEMTPGELSEAVFAVWSGAVQELVALLQNKPEAATVKSQVERLRDSYVGELVTLGRAREALSDGQRAEMSSSIEASLDAAAVEPWYLSYVDIYNSYSDGDLEFVNLLVAFNVPNYYADFDLLKHQAPEEATRLGIE